MTLIFFLKTKVNVFTNYNIATLLYCIYYSNYENIYSICYCWNYLIFFTFNGTYFLDKTCFKRLADKKNISLLTFHIGNVMVHNIPFIYVNYYLPIDVNFYHGLFAFLINIFWCFISTNGNMDLKEIYIELSCNNLLYVYAISFLSCINAPFVFQVIKILN
jgi:hypothetical protein